MRERCATEHSQNAHPGCRAAVLIFLVAVSQRDHERGDRLEVVIDGLNGSGALVRRDATSQRAQTHVSSGHRIKNVLGGQQRARARICGVAMKAEPQVDRARAPHASRILLRGQRRQEFEAAETETVSAQ